MRTSRALQILSFMALVSVLFQACVKAPGEAEHTHEEATNAAPVMEAAPAAAGVAIPPEVRQNLGITFAKVERRQVQDTMRVPGVFELQPGARHEYRALLAGHVALEVAQFEAVNAGDVLFSLDSPEWRRVQHEAVEAEGEIKIAQAAVAVARARMEEARVSEGIASERVNNLASVQVRNAALEAEAAALRGSLPRLQAEIDSAEAALEEAEEHYLSRLRTLGSITSTSVEDLKKTNAQGEPAWRAIERMEVRAKEAGVVEELPVNEGAWIETGTLVLSTLDPVALRFHGEAPQAEIGNLQDGMKSAIVPPAGGSVALQETMSGTLQLGLTAHPQDRTISVYVTPDEVAPWAKAGVTAYLEIPRTEAESELAIPTAALVQEGLDTIFFRRKPDDPNRVLPVKADLGASDGRWTVVHSGVKEGDEVVLEGGYALKLAGGTSKAPEGYHYHADGQLHKNH